MISCLLTCTPVVLENGLALKGRYLLPFPFRIDLFCRREAKRILKVSPSLDVYVSLK